MSRSRGAGWEHEKCPCEVEASVRPSDGSDADGPDAGGRCNCNADDPGEFSTAKGTGWRKTGNMQSRCDGEMEKMIIHCCVMIYGLN